MDGRARRGAIALCAAAVLAVTGVSLNVPRPTAAPTTPSVQEKTPDASPTVVPDRYLVQTAGTPTGLGGSKRANERARAKLLATAARVGATVDRTYDATWTGVSVTATPGQLAELTAVAGVVRAYQVYELSLNDPAAPAATGTSTDEQPSADDPDTEPASGQAAEQSNGTDEQAGADEEQDGTNEDPAESTPTTAAPDEAAVPYLEATPVDVLGNDTPGTDASLVPESVILTSPGADADGKRFEVPGKATFTVGSDGQVSVTSAFAWTGALEPVTYQVTDSTGATATATLTVTVQPPAAPIARDDTVRGTAGADLVARVLDNDDASGAASLQPETLCLPDGADCGTTLAAPEGTWTVAEGALTFSPTADFTGIASAAYRVADELGQTASATVTATVHPSPTAADHTAITAYRRPVTVTVLDDPQDPDGAALDPTSLLLRDAEGEAVDTLVVPGEGEYTADDEGRITFTPARRFTGAATPVDYEFRDVAGGTARAQLFVAVTVPAPPVAADDTATAVAGATTTVDVLTNDTAPGGTTLDPATVCLVTAADCASEVEDAAGAWAVTAEGAVRFTPAPGRAGTATIDYRVADELGRTAAATLTVSVDLDPTAVDDEAATLQGIAVDVSPLRNDAPGRHAAQPDTDVPFDPATLVLVDGDDSGTTLTTAAGTWTAEDGTVRLSPAPAFHGTATIAYRVTDESGRTTSATITVTVAQVTPHAEPDATGVPAWHEATVNVLGNDEPGDPAVPLDASVQLTDPDATEAGTLLTTTEGTWRVAGGTISFTPADDFTDATATTGYVVADANGTTATSTISVRLGALTLAPDNEEATPQNVTATLRPLDLVVPGDDGNGAQGTVSPDTLRFTGEGTLEAGRTLVVQNEGTWRFDDDGVATFDPESAFTGTAEARYTLTDSFGNTVAGLLRVVVAPVVPDLVADEAHTAANHAVTLDVLGNDAGGHASAPLRPGTLELVSSDPAAGTWTAHDGTLTFTPATDVSGTTTAQYRVRDNNNTPGTATVQVAVGALPQAVADTPSTPQDGATLVVTPTANDTAGDDGRGDPGRGTFPAGSLVLTDPAATAGGTKLTGSDWTWTVDATNAVRFTADWRFSGQVTTGYRVRDSFGNATTGTITVTVTPTAATATEKRLSAIGALQADVDGAGVKVGIIDSGINYTHPDLGGTSSSTFPTSRVTKGHDFVSDDDNPADCFGHGTHVAGIVGADGNPKLGGAYGVAPKVTFGAYRVFDCAGNSTTEDIVAAIERAFTDGMNVVNLSLGATSVSWPNETGYPLTQAAITLVKNGVVVVAAAGNTDKGLFTVGSPGVAPGVISVAATDAAATKVEGYSAAGPAADLTLSPTLSAPGSNVWSTVLGSGFAEKSGTSMAAPEVAGAVAELLQAKGWTTPAAGVPAKVAALLYASATPLSSSVSALKDNPEAVFRQGAGLLQLRAAIATTVTASPATLRLGEGTTETSTITLTNTGRSAVTYRASAATGTSAAASTGTRSDVGNQTPDWAWGAVGFKASPSSVTVPAGGTAKVKVTITAPAKILSGRRGLLYGGWVRFAAIGAPAVSVPFVGLRGDYQTVKMLPSGKRTFTGGGVEYTLPLPALAERTTSGDLKQVSSTVTFKPLKNDRPIVMYHLDYPTGGVRLKATNQKTKKSYYAVLSGTSTQLGRQGRDEGYSTLEFYGIYKTSKGKLAYIPAGTYKLQLRVLAPLGSSSKSSNWQTYTTRSFTLSWS